MLDTFSELLTLSLASDPALNAAQHASAVALTAFTTAAPVTTTIHRLESDYSTYADPAVIIIIDLDNVKP